MRSAAPCRAPTSRGPVPSGYGKETVGVALMPAQWWRLLADRRPAPALRSRGLYYSGRCNVGRVRGLALTAACTAWRFSRSGSRTPVAVSSIVAFAIASRVACSFSGNVQGLFLSCNSLHASEKARSSIASNSGEKPSGGWENGHMAPSMLTGGSATQSLSRRRLGYTHWPTMRDYAPAFRTCRGISLRSHLNDAKLWPCCRAPVRG